MKKIIFFGPPGAGKGTQAKLISKYLNVPHLSTGDILRAKIKQKDSLAIELKEILASGKLVSDNILNEIVSDQIINFCQNGFILDGYPRTLEQSSFLNKLLDSNSFTLDFIFNIYIQFDVLKERILKRSKEENRDDDNLTVIETRYSEYLNTTEKVSAYYKSKNSDIYNEIDGSLQIDEITSKIKKILKNSWISGKNHNICTWLRP